MRDRPDELDDHGEDLVVALHAMATDLGGATLADLALHAEARVALLNLLLYDPTVLEHLARWTAGTEVGRAAMCLGDHLERAAGVAGFAHPADLVAALEAMTGGDLTLPRRAGDAAEARRIAEEVRGLLEGAADLVDAFVAAIRVDEPDWVWDEAAALVRDRWGLPWPWLACELVSAWGNVLAAAPFGQRTVVDVWVEPTPLERPAPRITFETGPRETIAVATLRLADVVGALGAAADAAALPTGYRVAPELVARNTAWWYRHAILGESVRSLAGKDEGQRRRVGQGIARAAFWLGIASWIWRDEAA